MKSIVDAVILAGGAGRRMGLPAKPLAVMAGRPLVARVADRLRPQVRAMVLNVNEPLAAYEGFGLPLIRDTVPGRVGPLAGILAGMDWALAQPGPAEWLLSVPADAPFLPFDLAARLLEAAAGAGASFASSGDRDHSVIGLWPVARRADLAGLLASGIRRADSWPRALGATAVAWPDTPLDPFFNVNTPEDLARAEEIGSSPG
jgi:molybdopterin-guanine dinucleotide biosynthesis protein A